MIWGAGGLPLLRDPEPVPGCDILITESTYGNRVHPPAVDLKNRLLEIIRETYAVDGRVIIPAFSLGRTQQVVYFLNELTNSGSCHRFPYLSTVPLSRRLTSVYRHHKSVMDEEVQQLLDSDSDPWGIPRHDVHRLTKREHGIESPQRIFCGHLRQRYV